MKKKVTVSTKPNPAVDSTLYHVYREGAKIPFDSFRSANLAKALAQAKEKYGDGVKVSPYPTREL